MRNAPRDILNTNVLQLEAMVPMFAIVAGDYFDGMSPAERGNYIWVMSDLVGGIKAALAVESEARND